MRYHGNPSFDLFKEPAYAQFRQTLDSEMKQLQGLGSSRKQAEQLTEQEAVGFLALLLVTSDTVNRICMEAGIQGFKTHSLRSTATSCLYQAGVDEQLVMEWTDRPQELGRRSKL